MKKLLIAVSAAASFLLTLVLFVPAGWAATTTLVANLTGASESPPVVSPGTGMATVVLDTTANTMAVNIVFSGLTSGTTASHIHCCLPTPFQTGVNVMVATTTPTFPNFPLGVTSGIYSMLFDLTNPTTYNSAFIASSFVPSHTVAEAETVLVSALLAGETYLNIHTTNFPNGEIRGFLSAVPEPSTWAMMLIGFCGLGFAVRRSRRKVPAQVGTLVSAA
jgi:CHRD domain/PEP-CTERM motif